METKWKDMHVSLSQLSVSVQEFFTKKGFTVDANESDGKHQILVKPKTHHKILERIQVTIAGDSDDFSVRFSVTSRSRGFMIFGAFTALLGGGFLASKGLRSDETVEKIERDFRMFIAERVWELRSAT